VKHFRLQPVLHDLELVLRARAAGVDAARRDSEASHANIERIERRLNAQAPAPGVRIDDTAAFATCAEFFVTALGARRAAAARCSRRWREVRAEWEAAYREKGALERLRDRYQLQQSARKRRKQWADIENQNRAAQELEG